MSDHAAFIAAVSASPDDDLPRLVYADWLDEGAAMVGCERCRGSGKTSSTRAEPTTCPACGGGGRVSDGRTERAEFIRVQCELERVATDDDRRPALQRREKALLKKHAGGWMAEAVAVVSPSDEQLKEWRFRRGFLHAVSLPAQRFAGVVEGLFAVAPTVRAVQLCHGVGSVRGLLDVPLLSRVHDLDLSRMCSCGRCPILDELRSLFASELVGGLTRLRVSGDRIDPETTTALVSSPHLTRLSSLDLSGNAVGLHGTRVLAAHQLDGLAELNLSENGITPYGGRVLASAPWLQGLRVLNLSRNRLGDTGARALLKAEFGERLERLDVQTNDIQQEMKKALRAKFGPKVRV